MADTNAVPIPQGATIGDSNQSTPTAVPIPQGATIGDTLSGSQGPIVDTIGKVGEEGAKVATGFVKGAGDTVAGVSSLIHKIPKVGETLAPEQGIQSLEKQTEKHGLSEEVGSGLEGLAEFASGDEALEAVAKGAKLVEMARRFPAVARAMEMAEKSKVLSKIMTGAGKAAVVGGAQGVVKG